MTVREGQSRGNAGPGRASYRRSGKTIGWKQSQVDSPWLWILDAEKIGRRSKTCIACKGPRPVPRHLRQTDKAQKGSGFWFWYFKLSPLFGSIELEYTNVRWNSLTWIIHNSGCESVSPSSCYSTFVSFTKRRFMGCQFRGSWGRTFTTLRH